MGKFSCDCSRLFQVPTDCLYINQCSAYTAHAEKMLGYNREEGEK